MNILDELPSDIKLANVQIVKVLEDPLGAVDIAVAATGALIGNLGIELLALGVDADALVAGTVELSRVHSNNVIAGAVDVTTGAGTAKATLSVVPSERA